MTSALANDRTIVARLRLRGGRSVDALSTRLRLESLLGAADLRPRSLAPSAILCVRRLVDPLPGALSLRRLDLRPPPSWERAIGLALDDLARRAARPADGAVPPSAEAVVFADRAELLACLAADLLSGSIAQRWWWARLVDDAPSPRAVIAAFVAAPEHAPAAIVALSSRSLAAPLLALFAPDEARALLESVVARYGLVEIHAALASLDAAPALDRAASAAPLLALVPDLALPEVAALAPPARALIAVSLLLSRAPALARRASIATSIASFAAPASVNEIALAPTNSPPEPEIAPVSRDVAAPIEATPAVAPAPSSLSRDASDEPPALDEPPIALTDLATSPPRESPLAATPDLAPPIPARDTHPRSPAAPEPAEPAILIAPSPPPAVAATPDLPPPITAPRPALAAAISRALGAPVHTELGGLFFLVNVALYLGLYPDFTRPLDRGLDLPIWDFITLVGRALLGDDWHPGDPVWPLLAALAGRALDDPPGLGFEPPEQDEHEYAIPPEWAGPLDLNPAPITADSPLERWLGRLIPYLRARLRRALGVEDPAEIAVLALRRRARIHLTEGHLDVSLSLAELPIEVRLAGLDRDPGWVPAAGRYVAFHFD